MKTSQRSLSKSVGSLALFGAIAASAGFIAYRLLSKGEKEGKVSSKKKSKRSKGSISRKRTSKEAPVPQVRDHTSKKVQNKVSWIPNLRVREQKILNVMPQSSEVGMSEIARHFPDVTVRTLRRDMDRLVEKGRVKRSGTTRATTYLKV